MQETRLFDPKAGTTHSMRRKEEAHDYRYFPEPDLVPLTIDAAFVARVAAAMPELPEARRRRYVEALGLPEYDAGVLTADPALAAWFEAAVGRVPPAQDGQQLGHGRAAAPAARRRPRRARLPGAAGRARGAARGGRARGR